MLGKIKNKNPIVGDKRHMKNQRRLKVKEKAREHQMNTKKKNNIDS
jgi:hypothetical protein